MCSVKLEVEGFMGIRAPHKVDPSVAPIPLKPMHPTPPKGLTPLCENPSDFLLLKIG